MSPDGNSLSLPGELIPQQTRKYLISYSTGTYTAAAHRTGESDGRSKEVLLSKASESHINLVNSEPQTGKLKTLVGKGWTERCPGEGSLSSFAECSVLISVNLRQYQASLKQPEKEKLSKIFK